MFEVASPASTGSDEAVPIDTTSALLGELLDAATLASFSVRDILPVLELSYKYDCPVVTARLTDHLRETKTKSPWDIFVIAANHSDLRLGRNALVQMDRHYPFEDWTGPDVSQAERLPLAWLLGFLQVLYNVRRDAASGHYMRNGKSAWALHGATFEPRKTRTAQTAKSKKLDCDSDRDGNDMSDMSISESSDSDDTHGSYNVYDFQEHSW